MSEYFRVLNRLLEQGGSQPSAAERIALPRPFERREAGRSERPPRQRQPVAPLRVLSRPPEADAPIPASADETREGNDAPVRVSGLQEIFDTLRKLHLNGSASTRCLVLAPASGSEDIEGLALKAAEYARTRGLVVDPIRACGAQGRGMLRHDSRLEDLRLEMQRPEWSDQLASWIENRPVDSVALLIAPPLAGSSEGALIANACDGLAVLVEIGRTPRPALAQAVKRARTVGCELLGLVVIGSDGLPSWARRLRDSLD